MEMTEAIVERTDDCGEDQDVDTHNKMSTSKIRQAGRLSFHDAANCFFFFFWCKFKLYYSTAIMKFKTTAIEELRCKTL